MNAQESPSELHSIVGGFESVVARQPAAPAATWQGRLLTFAELNRAANGVAAALLRGAPTSDAPVTLLLQHDLSSIIAFVGVLKSGHPHVALDPRAPPAMLKRLLHDAGSHWLISTRPFEPLARELVAAGWPRLLFLDDLDLSAPADNPRIYVPPEAVFAIFYTSGSTGEPKGLIHTHGLAWDYSAGPNAVYATEPADRIAMLRPLRTPPHAGWLLGSLQSGATVCLFDFASRGPAGAAEWFRSERITIFPGTPSIMRAIMESLPEGALLPSVRYVRLGGEPVRVSDLELLKAHTPRGCVFENALGSTDAVMVARARFDHDSVVSGEMLPVGNPIPGRQVSVVGKDGLQVQDGQVGELVIRSAHLSAGYWKNAALTRERFKADPAEPGVLTFYSGDLARRRPDGMLEFVGRSDSMVKIRGQRVDLLEVEAAMRSLPQLRDAVVLARESRLRGDQTELVGYAVVHPGTRVTPSEILRQLAAGLPAYMVPAQVMLLDRLPIGPHGKLDHRALPDVGPRADLELQDMPADELEARLVEIWQAGLRTDRVSVHDNYFELGGDSLSVLSMILEVEKALGRVVPQQFFQDPTVRAMASLLRAPGPAAYAAPGEFRLHGHRRAGAPPPASPVRRSMAKARRRIRELRRTLDWAYPFEWLLARSSRDQTFTEFVEAAEWLADRHALVRVVYGPKRKLFERFLASVGVAPGGVEARFRMNLITNLVLKAAQGREPFGLDEARLPAADPRRPAGQLSMEELEDLFQVTGREVLRDAISAGRGAILVSIHGTGLYGNALEALSRRLGVERIQTIAQRMPLQQSRYWGSGTADHLPGAVGSALRAELAFHAQSLLRRGQVIHVSPDVIALEGPTHEVRIGDRIYAMSGGIAELALNTGAPVIPAFGRFIERTRLLVELLPPLEAGAGSREQQIRNLLDGYGAFATDACRRHPETISWKKMRNHLKWPRVQPG
jgi:amino acid adenylation domain-containing protein